MQVAMLNIEVNLRDFFMNSKIILRSSDSWNTLIVITLMRQIFFNMMIFMVNWGWLNHTSPIELTSTNNKGHHPEGEEYHTMKKENVRNTNYTHYKSSESCSSGYCYLQIQRTHLEEQMLWLLYGQVSTGSVQEPHDMPQLLITKAPS
jgi:hypothetical protein